MSRRCMPPPRLKPTDAPPLRELGIALGIAAEAELGVRKIIDDRKQDDVEAAGTARYSFRRERPEKSK